MKSISSSAGLCSAIIAITCVSATAKGETWSCDQSMADKTVKQVWIVSGDRLTTPSDERYYRIVRNDQHILGDTKLVEVLRLSLTSLSKRQRAL
jgi:hypothetical protein